MFLITFINWAILVGVRTPASGGIKYKTQKVTGSWIILNTVKADNLHSSPNTVI
jgi:hypothetical protein